jgi:hypothetical protein
MNHAAAAMVRVQVLFVDPGSLLNFCLPFRAKAHRE